jgi:hypothetical protein
MCRSIQTLRPPYLDDVTEEQIRAAALQYVRKVAGMRAPSAANRQAFDDAVEQIASATAELLGGINVRSSRQPAATTTVDKAL